MGVGGRRGAPFPPLPECAEQTRWGWRLMVKATLGNPARSGPHPESSPQNPRAAFFGLQGCGELTHPGAYAPLARPCRLRGAGGSGAEGERVWAGRAGVASISSAQGGERAPTLITEGKLSQPGAQARVLGHRGALFSAEEERVLEGGVPPSPFQVCAHEGAGVRKGSTGDARGQLAGGGRPSRL